MLLSGRINQVKAGCCGDDQCPNGQCVNEPSPYCGGSAGEGVCVNDLETCSSDSDCLASEYCGERLCRGREGPSCECGVRADGSPNQAAPNRTSHRLTSSSPQVKPTNFGIKPTNF